MKASGGGNLYKLIAVDVDGTLFDSENRLSEENIEAVQKVQDLGIKVVPFTGRAFYTLEEAAKAMKLRDAVATQNGSIVVNPIDGSIIFSHLISPQKVAGIITYAHEKGLFPLIYQGDRVYGGLKGKYLEIFEKTMNMKVDYAEDLLKVYSGEPLGKILILDEPERIREFYSWLLGTYGSEIFAAFSYDFALEIGSISKGRSMLMVAGHFGIQPDEIMAIGDGENDMEMMSIAGFSVAMENAMDEVKSQADFVTLSNNHSGVAYAINKFILNRNAE